MALRPAILAESSRDISNPVVLLLVHHGEPFFGIFDSIVRDAMSSQQGLKVVSLDLDCGPIRSSQGR